MLMSLGFFIFEINNVTFDKISENLQFNWSNQQKIGSYPDNQFIGIGENKITLTGIIIPELTKSQNGLQPLTLMAKTGKSWLLIDGHGRNIGQFFIKSISKNKSNLLEKGAARKISFTLSLIKTENNPDNLGDLII